MGDEAEEWKTIFGVILYLLMLFSFQIMGVGMCIANSHQQLVLSLSLSATNIFLSLQLLCHCSLIGLSKPIQITGQVVPKHRYIQKSLSLCFGTSCVLIPASLELLGAELPKTSSVLFSSFHKGVATSGWVVACPGNSFHFGEVVD